MDVKEQEKFLPETRKNKNKQNVTGLKKTKQIAHTRGNNSVPGLSPHELSAQYL